MEEIAEMKRSQVKSNRFFLVLLGSVLVIILGFIRWAAAADLPPVQISTTNPPRYYQTLSEAYQNASNADIIKVKNTTFDGFTINRDVTVTFQGGYNTDFSSVIGSTYINGVLTATTGTTTIGDFKIISSPLVTISSPTAVLTKNNAPQLIYSACCGTAIVKVDGTAVSKASGSTLDPLADGAHVVRIDTTDSFGGPVFSAVTFTVDTTPPLGTVLISSGATYTTGTSVTLTLTATDATSCVSQMQFSNDNSTWSALGSYATTTTWTLSTGDGTKTVYARYKDSAGNTSNTMIQGDIILDTVGPVVIISSPVASTTKERNPLLLYTNSEGNAVVTVDGIIVSKVSGTILDTLSDGVHVVRVDSTDAAGNLGFDQKTFTIDNQTFITIDPLNSPVSSNSQVFTGTMEANSVVSLSINTSASVGPVSYPTATSWTCTISGIIAGNNTITASAVDAATNTASISITIDPGIIGLWHMDGNWDDSSGYANHGVPSLNPAFSSDAHFGSYSGMFDGIDDAVSTPNSLQVTAPDNFTIELWTSPTLTIEFTGESNSYPSYSGVSGQRYAVVPASGGATDAGAGLSIGTTGISVFEHGGDYVQSLLVYAGNLSGWNHIVVVYENKTPKLYLNGAYVKTGQTSLRTHVYPSSSFGNAFSGPYGGLMDEIVIYNRSLTAAEISSRYNQTAPALTSRILGDVTVHASS